MSTRESIANREPRLVLDACDYVPDLPGLGQERTTAFETELGWIAALWQGGKLARLTFGHGSSDGALEAIDRLGIESPRLAHAHRALVARLQAYTRGARDEFSDVPVLLAGLTQFAQRVVGICRDIGYGDTITYGQLAALAGSPGAARAVGNVMAANRIPLVVPCHRVVGSAGSLGGFSAPSGLCMKRRLLEIEGSLAVRR